MKKIEGQIENLFVSKTKYDFIKNSGKQATISAALGAAVGSSTLASQAVLVANSQWDVKECSFELNGQKYDGIFEDIYFSNNAQLICLVQDNIVLVLIDPKDNKMYIPIGTGDNVEQLKKKCLYMFLGFFFIGVMILFFIGGDVGFLILAICVTILFSFFLLDQYINLKWEKVY